MSALWIRFGRLVTVILVLALVASPRVRGDDPVIPLPKADQERLDKGLGAGVVSGFFGIGGGFLIVPGLIAATRMPMIAAVGTSLVAVTAFGLTTAANYAFSGLVNWELALVFIVGGVLGSFLGTLAARRLSGGGHLKTVFAGLIFVVAAYMLWQSASALGI